MRFNINFFSTELIFTYFPEIDKGFFLNLPLTKITKINAKFTVITILNGYL